MLKQLFCKHKYIHAGYIPTRYIYEKEGKEKSFICGVTLYECEKCGKRFYVAKDKMFYSKVILKELNLWKKHQFDFTANYLEALKEQYGRDTDDF